MGEGIGIARREIDVRPIIGAAVVFLILGSIVFGIYYFLIAKPAADSLEASKLSAMSQVSSLNSIGTSMAISDASTYSAQIQAAGSTAEVDAVLIEVSSAILREQERKDLLDKATAATNGSFYSASGAGDTQQVASLSTLLQALLSEINGKNTLSELQSYEASGTIDAQATTAWQSFLTSVINGKHTDNLLMKSNSQTSWYFMSKTSALSHVATSTWQDLIKLDFEGTNYIEVPISDTVNRAPTIKAGSTVNVYVYDRGTAELHLIVGNATVSSVIYSKDDLATIAWSMTSGTGTTTTAQSYSVNIWETLKAAAAGSTDAAAIGWQSYGSDLMDRALNADTLDFTVNAIYVVKVPTEAGENIIQIDFYQSETKDVVLAAQTI